MNNQQRKEQQNQNDTFLPTDDLLIDIDIDPTLDDDQESQPVQYRHARGFNMQVRHRIEERLEQKRLMQELGDYDLLDPDDDRLH